MKSVPHGPKETALFGADGRVRNTELWLRWLRRNHSYAAEAFDRLVDDECDRNQLTLYVMELHATRPWKPIDNRKAKATFGRLKKAATSVKVLAESDLRYFLGEE